MKKIPLTYTFNKTAKTITCDDFSRLEMIALITNLTSGVDIYHFLDPNKGGTLSGNVLTLEYDTSAMNNGDVLQILMHPDVFTENGAMSVGNAKVNFRDGFVTGFDSTVWDEAWTNQGTGLRFIGGNAMGSSYLGISMAPEMTDSEYILTSKQTFRMPTRFGFGLSISQRIIGQEIELSLVGCDDSGNVEINSTLAPLTISGTVAITSNVATINFATAHGLRGGDRVILVGNTENRLNVGPVIVTVVTPTQITVPCTLANGTYTAGGTVVWTDPFDYVKNAVGVLYENATVTNATYQIRRNGSSYFGLNQTIGTTVATQNNTSPYTDAFRAAVDNDLIATIEHTKLVSRPASSQSAATLSAKYTESLPDEDKLYKLRLRVRNLPNFTKVGADISAIAKTGTTTATVTTATPHGLTVGQFVQIYGVLDITNFPNLTALTAVASVIDANNFTIIIGGAVTASSVGGVIALNQGSVLLPGALNFSVQSIQAAANVLTITLNTTAAGLLPGELIHLTGMSAATAYEGVYRVMRLTGSTIEVQKVTGTITDIGLTTTGGAIIKRTDVRLHYARALEYTRHLMEISNNRGSSDAGESLPTVITNTPTVTATVTAATMYPIIAAAAATGIALTPHKLISLATTNATSVKASAGRIGGGLITNTSAAYKFFKLYNKASAPTVGTDVPVHTIAIPPNTIADLESLGNVFGISFATGIAYATTNLAADNDATAVAAGDLIINLQYI